LKHGTRTAVILKIDHFFLCVFRGEFLEGFFIGDSKDQVERALISRDFHKQISYSNFSLGKPYSGELEVKCLKLGTMLEEKLKNHERGSDGLSVT